MKIRAERPGDAGPIASVISAAFSGAGHSNGTEANIVDRLRRAGALTISLVAEDERSIVGHVAFSPVMVDGRDCRWFGLGPVAVEPGRQHDGIGSGLINDGLAQLRAAGASGCFVLGEPAYYGRFGFIADERLKYPGPPPEYFQVLAFQTDVPRGTVAYHPAFG